MAKRKTRRVPKAGDADKTRLIIVPGDIQVMGFEHGKRVPLQVLISRDTKTGEEVTETDSPWNLLGYLTKFVFPRDEWNSITMSRIASKILDALEDMGEEVELAIDGSYWTKLCETLNLEDFKIPYPFNVSLVPFSDCILDAGLAPDDDDDEDLLDGDEHRLVGIT